MPGYTSHQWYPSYSWNKATVDKLPSAYMLPTWILVIIDKNCYDNHLEKANIIHISCIWILGLFTNLQEFKKIPLRILHRWAIIERMTIIHDFSKRRHLHDLIMRNLKKVNDVFWLNNHWLNSNYWEAILCLLAHS